jgi:hypothetical protein
MMDVVNSLTIELNEVRAQRNAGNREIERLSRLIDHIESSVPQPVVVPSLGQWVKVTERLPTEYLSVFIRLSDGHQEIGRLNHAGYWQIASYQDTKYQYMSSDVIEWFDSTSIMDKYDSVNE